MHQVFCQGACRDIHVSLSFVCLPGTKAFFCLWLPIIRIKYWKHLLMWHGCGIVICYALPPTALTVKGFVSSNLLNNINKL